MHPKTVSQSLILETRTRSGWVDERPSPSPAQIDELMALVGDRIPEARLQEARIFMSHIFVKAVEDTALLRRLRVEAVEYADLKGASRKLVTVLAKELAGLETASSDGGMPEQVSDGLRRTLAATQFLKRGLPSPSTAAREVDAVVDDALGLGKITPELRRLLDDVAMAVKTGRDRSIHRQMVRGLAALLENVTGKCPGRSYFSSAQSRSKVGERGWFHTLCKRFAQLVNGHEMIPAEMRETRAPSLDGLINEELKALRAEISRRAS